MATGHSNETVAEFEHFNVIQGSNPYIIEMSEIRRLMT